MGELRTRKRGKTWEYSFEGARINGKRNPISKGGFRTKADALAAGTQAKAEYDNTGRTFRPADLSLADYMDYWYTNYVQKNLSYNTQADYERKTRIHIKPALGIYRLMSIEPDTIQRWIDAKKEDGYSRNMVKSILSCLSAALDYAVYPCQYIKSNPCHYVRIPKIKDDPIRKAHTEYICTPEDFTTIIQRFPQGSNFYIPLMTGYHCGTRLGETYGFDLLQDVDFESHTISIRHQLKKEHGVWCYRSPKYDSYRTIQIDAKFENILKHEIRERKKKYAPLWTILYKNLPPARWINHTGTSRCSTPLQRDYADQRKREWGTAYAGIIQILRQSYS